MFGESAEGVQGRGMCITIASVMDAWGWDSVEMRGDRTLYPS